jgi:hypothetical protein
VINQSEDGNSNLNFSITKYDIFTCFKGQTDGKFPIIRYPDKRHRGHEKSEGPTSDHDVGRVSQAQPLVQVHRVGDGVVSLQRDDGECEHTQLGAQDAKKSSSLKEVCYMKN